MSKELQATDDKYEIEGNLDADVGTEPEVDDQVEAEEAEDTDSAPAPDSGDNHEKTIKFDADQQRVFDDAIAKKVFKQREAERETQRLRRELDEVKARLPQQSRPMIPETPDPFAYSDQEYRQRMAYRDQALVQAAHWDQQQNGLKHQEQVRQNDLARKQQEVMVNNIKTYSDRAVKLGMKPEELQAAGNKVSQFGIDDSLVRHILNDEHGPLITKYLSQNLQELEDLSYMEPMDAAVRISTVIKSKLDALRPRINKTPDPLTKMSGSGRTPKQSGPRGAIFE